MEVTLYCDQHIYDHYGTQQLEHAYDYVVEGLSAAGVGYKVSAKYTIQPIDGRDVPDGYAMNTRDRYDNDPGTMYDVWYYFLDWLKDDNEYVDNPDGNIYYDQDAYHLVMDEAQIGGAGGLGGGNCSVAPGSNLNKIDYSSSDAPRYLSTDEYPSAAGQVQILMQELGHALGLCPDTDHNCGLHYSDSHSYADNVPETGDVVYTTPMGAQRTEGNVCGGQNEGMDPDSASTEYKDARYYDPCAGQKLRNQWN